MRNDQLEDLYIKYSKELFLYAFSLCKDYHLAQDLTSDSFFKAYISLDDKVDYFKYWLFKVCKNLYLDYLKKKVEFVSPEILEASLPVEDNILNKLIESEEKRYIYGLVIALKDPYREVLILYYYCDFSIKEISLSKGLSESNVKIILFRGRKILKRGFDEDYEV